MTKDIFTLASICIGNTADGDDSDLRPTFRSFYRNVKRTESGTNQGKETSSRLVSLTATRAPVWLDKRKNKKATTQLHAKGR